MGVGSGLKQWGLGGSPKALIFTGLIAIIGIAGFVAGIVWGGSDRNIEGFLSGRIGGTPVRLEVEYLKRDRDTVRLRARFVDEGGPPRGTRINNAAEKIRLRKNGELYPLTAAPPRAVVISRGIHRDITLYYSVPAGTDGLDVVAPGFGTVRDVNVGDVD